MTINQRLKILREYLKLSQGDFSAAIGLTQGGYSDIERGRREPSEMAIELISSKYAVSREWLLEGAGEMLTPKEPESKVTVSDRVEEIIERMRLDHEAEKRELYDIIKHDREIQRSLIEQLKKVK